MTGFDINQRPGDQTAKPPVVLKPTALPYRLRTAHCRFLENAPSGLAEPPAKSGWVFTIASLKRAFGFDQVSIALVQSPSTDLFDRNCSRNASSVALFRSIALFVVHKVSGLTKLSEP
jgi:hypothetical protein